MDAHSVKEHSTNTSNNNNNNRNGSEGDDQNSEQNNANNATVRRNPSILLALDTVHRSLLLKNLQFDKDTTTDNDGDSFSDGGSGICDEGKQKLLHTTREDPLDGLTQSAEVAKVSSEEVDFSEHDANSPLQTQIKQIGGIDVSDRVLELVKHGRDRNNNNNYNDSRVMMMVAKYESQGRGAKSGPIDDTETSDYETPSASCSSLGSVRSSSTFSDGSRDVMSVDNFGGQTEAADVVGTGESHRVTAGAATITINIINKTADNCDTRPLRTSPEMKAVQVQVPESVTDEDIRHATSSEEEEESTECELDELKRDADPVPMIADTAEMSTDQSYDNHHFQTAESQDFLECGSGLDSSNSCYNDSSDDLEDVSEIRSVRSNQSGNVSRRMIDDVNEPMINIVQELTHDMQITSTVILNKSKIKDHRKKRAAEKKQKQKKEKKKMDSSIFSRQKIIDDNFCNEILDSTIHFDRLYGINRKTAVETPIEVLSDSAIQASSAGDESFDSSLSIGKLEGKPRYSGRPIGRLMARRMKKLDKPTSSKSEGLSDSSASNYANGPKKPPRTFAASSCNSSKIGWVTQTEANSQKPKLRKPSCPELKDLDSDPELLGWKFNRKDKKHDIGWTVPKQQQSTDPASIPPHIYSMLHYSDDDNRKRLIKSSNLRAAPQSQSCCHHVNRLAGPKLEIDTVDGAAGVAQRKSSSNSEFERFVADSKVKSTPHKRRQHREGRRSELFLQSERSERIRKSPDRRRRTTGDILEREKKTENRHFLDDGRRSDHEPEEGSSSICKKCNEKSEKKSFRKAAVRRTKSFFEASKKKIHLQALKKKPKPKERFETPKKCELGSNLNKENSIKKQLHKHLGYTPDHLRCGSCPKRSGMVRNNLIDTTNSAPARITSGNDVCRPRYPARTVLNFSGPEMASEDGTVEDSRKQKSHEIKFLKTLKNLKISPKKLFKSNDNSKSCPLAESPRQYGDFQSYDDLNLDNIAQMGDFLNNVRQAVEVERQNNSHDLTFNKIYMARYSKPVSCSTPRNRHVSTSTELLDRVDQRRVEVCADLHQEPIYQEISPKNNKTIINEFLSGESNNRHVMINNNPNVLYATVNKIPKNLIKRTSFSNCSVEHQQNQPNPVSVKKLNAELPSPTRLNTSTDTQSNFNGSKLRRSLFHTPACGGGPNRSGSMDDDNDISVLQEDNDELRLVSDGRDSRKAEPVVDIVEEMVLRKHVSASQTGTRQNKHDNGTKDDVQDDDGYRVFSSDIHRSDSGTMERGALTCEEQLQKTAMKADTVGRAPLGSIDTSDEEIESLQKYGDRCLDELVTSLRENITLSEIGTIDTESEAFVTGFDTVDFNPVTPSRRNDLEAASAGNNSDKPNSTIDTDNISELMSAHDYSVSNLSPVNSSPSSGKMRMNSSDIYRNLKDKLRTSFRKSKNFIKSEQRKIVNYFDDKPTKREEGNRVAFDLDEYRNKYIDDTETEEIYQSLSNAGSLVELSNQFLAELVNQIKTQCDIKKQLKQALSVCRNTREFECSSELIEAERLMLLSTLKETAARNELSKIDYNSNGKVLNEGKKVGIVALNHFEFPLKEAAVNDMLFNYFYVMVCSYKNQVKATLSKERNKDRVYFRDCEIEFHDLDAEYEIRVEVFVLRLRKNARNFSFESKYHLNKENKNLLGSCPSPPKVLSPAKLLTSRSSSPKNYDFDNEFSRFKSQGFITLTSFSLLPSNSTLQLEGNEQLLENCRHSPYYSASSNFQRMVRRQGDHNVYLMEDFKYLKLDSMVYNSNLLGSIGMSVKSEVLFVNSDISGFLTVGQSRTGSIDWSRKWCKLNGFVLEFWNYPQECQEKLPTVQIDLTKCICDGVELADRSTCSRPRTFRLDVFVKGSGSCSSSGISSYKDTDSHQQQQQMHNRNSDSHHQQQQQSTCDNTKIYLLSVDTPNELKMWLNELNRVVKFLKEWKI
ncbi:uncharacterized protein LOC131439144 [Malaya genurostris]|uniref:uncharacterized protein LOC131439144 n=1 Tax=Malaya genurostris TaxID=325434 RepID=UPI0026F3D686|nr:uncharacterized protein LOC131439144 [Malaya genurostris]